jgi:hypothetical protein
VPNLRKSPSGSRRIRTGRAALTPRLAAGVVANLAFEKIGLDLYVVAAVAVFAVVLLWRQPRQLILRYYAVAFGLGLVVTAVIKAVR